MLLKDLSKMIQAGEGERLEFKHKAADPQKIMKEVVAFANHKGGRLILGIDDDLTIRGVKFANEEEFVMKQAIEKYCLPIPEYSIQRITITQKRTILIFNIKESEQKPVFLIYNLKKKVGRAYFRVADKSVQASKELRKILKIQYKNTDSSFFQYGEHEQKLMQLFHEQEEITLQQFVEHAQISTQLASETLIKLTVSNVLEIIPNDEADSYVLKEEG